MSADGDLVGIDATLVRLDDFEVTLVRLRLTDDGVTTMITLALDHARTFTRLLGDVVEAGSHEFS